MSNNIMTVRYQSELQIKAIVKLLSSIYECQVRPRGRHSDRKKVLGYKWRKFSQNDIPWRMAETVTFYKLSK
jgi:hypothetical protein